MTKCKEGRGPGPMDQSLCGLPNQKSRKPIEELVEDEEVRSSAKREERKTRGRGRIQPPEKTGKRIVEQLLAKGFAVKAGVRDAEMAKTILPSSNEDLHFVKANVTEGIDKSAAAVGNDLDVVICAT
ncbi:hypothetical protein R6Q57_010661, partial [Mikania cordata]